MIFDFLLGPVALGTSHGVVRRLDPTRLGEDPRGLSGTEVNVLGLAFALARLGHEVRLYSHFAHEVVHETPTGRLLFRELTPRGCAPGADVAIAFHDPQPLRSWEAPCKFMWHQTVCPPDHLADRKSTRLNSSHIQKSRMPSSA